MSADAYFHIGHSHTVCQDYAVARQHGEREIAVVADGCSSSPDTDCGARLIAAGMLGWADPVLVWGDDDARKVIATAADHAAVVGWPSMCVDATIVAVRREPTVFRAFVVGDGVVVARRRDGTFRVVDVEFPSGAPAYASYLANEPRRGNYLRTEPDTPSRDVRIVRVYDGDSVTEASSLARSAGWVLELVFPVVEFELAAVASDGLRSFQRRTGTRFAPVPLLEVVPHVFGFKGLAGEFVARRLRRFLRKECEDMGWHPNDDVAVAAIHAKGAPS
ncbi:MAG: hypothetical protein EXR71_19205 [Myxococcales bacterium]|nr:hypothetical protein [Myxococcales bacterium]